MKEYGYLQYPLCLQIQTFKDREKGLNQAISYGIVNYAKKLKYQMTDVAKQTLYDYFRNHSLLQPRLSGKLSDAIEEGSILTEGDNPGFDGKGSYSPENDFTVTPLLKMFEDDPQLRDDAVLNYQIHLATSENHLSIKVGSYGSNIKRYEEARSLQETFEARHGGDAMPYCKNSLLFQYRDNPASDIDVLRAYIGINSLIGRRNFISTTKPVILSRMIGCKSKTAFDYYSKDKFIRPTVAKYSTRYHMDKLLMTLVEQKYIMYLTRPHVSLIYVSKYMEPEELAKLVNQSQCRYALRGRIKAASQTLGQFTASI